VEASSQIDWICVAKPQIVGAPFDELAAELTKLAAELKAQLKEREESP